MNINQFVQKPNTPVPIPRNASIEEEKNVIAGNVAVRDLGKKRKERQRLTLQDRIKWTEKERFTLGKLAAETTTANAVKTARKEHPLANESTIRIFRKSYLLAIAKDRNFGNTTSGVISKKKWAGPCCLGLMIKSLWTIPGG